MEELVTCFGVDELTRSQRDVYALRFDLGDVGGGSRGLVTEILVLCHLHFAGGILQSSSPASCIYEVLLQVTSGGARNILSKILTSIWYTVILVQGT